MSYLETKELLISAKQHSPTSSTTAASLACLSSLKQVSRSGWLMLSYVILKCVTAFNIPPSVRIMYTNFVFCLFVDRQNCSLKQSNKHCSQNNLVLNKYKNCRPTGSLKNVKKHITWWCNWLQSYMYSVYKKPHLNKLYRKLNPWTNPIHWL